MVRLGLGLGIRLMNQFPITIKCVLCGMYFDRTKGSFSIVDVCYKHSRKKIELAKKYKMVFD